MPRNLYIRTAVGFLYGFLPVSGLSAPGHRPPPPSPWPSLEAKGGAVRWNKQLGDPQLRYFAIMARLVIGEHVLVSVSGDVTGHPGLPGVRRSGNGRRAVAMEHRAGTSSHRRGSPVATNWMAPSFDPQTGLFYVNARRMFIEFYLTEAGKAEGWAGRDRNLWSTSCIQALDYRKGKIRWRAMLSVMPKVWLEFDQNRRSAVYWR